MASKPPIRVRRVRTGLSAEETRAIRAILWAAFPSGEEAFTEDDWEHALGGVHVVLETGGVICGHAAVVERGLEIAGRPIRTGYVEAVAVDPARQRQGLGTRLMEDVNAIVRDAFELGALGTGVRAFYERLGWRTWQGPTGVRSADGRVTPTPDDDGYVMVLATPSSPGFDPRDPITCDWRPGDAW